MKQILLGATTLGAALAFPVFGYAQSGIVVGGGIDIGQREYFYKCAVCHGNTGKGDGQLVEFLRKSPTDLTNIQKNNGGVFPFDKLYEVIDGREAVAAHGPREMPVWGNQFRLDAADLGRGFGLSRQNAESFVQGRIIALIGYIYTLQAK